jgi:hypothetical protein
LRNVRQFCGQSGIASPCLIVDGGVHDVGKFVEIHAFSLNQSRPMIRQVIVLLGQRVQKIGHLCQFW